MPTHSSLIGAHLLNYAADLPYAAAEISIPHVDAWLFPRPDSSEAAIVGLVTALGAYADGHRSRAGTSLREDGELGPVWRTIAEQVRYLLRGDVGRLDVAAVNRLVNAMLAEEYGQ